jgi:hypothetical protein
MAISDERHAGKEKRCNVEKCNISTNCLVFETFRRSSSVTKIGSEEPILVTASPRGKRLRPKGALGGQRPPPVQSSLNNHLAYIAP